MARSHKNARNGASAQVDESDEEMGEIEWSQTQRPTQVKSQKGKEKATATQNGANDSDRNFLTYDPDMPEAAKREVRIAYRQLMEATVGECSPRGRQS
jgi:hypothetical protein